MVWFEICLPNHHRLINCSTESLSFPTTASQKAALRASSSNITCLALRCRLPLILFQRSGCGMLRRTSHRLPSTHPAQSCSNSLSFIITAPPLPLSASSGHSVASAIPNRSSFSDPVPMPGSHCTHLPIPDPLRAKPIRRIRRVIPRGKYRGAAVLSARRAHKGERKRLGRGRCCSVCAACGLIETDLCCIPLGLPTDLSRPGSRLTSRPPTGISSRPIWQ